MWQRPAARPPHAPSLARAQASRERAAHAAASEAVWGAVQRAVSEQALIDAVARRKVAAEQVRQGGALA